MAKLTKTQKTELHEALRALERARRYLCNPGTAVARRCPRATTALHYTRADGTVLYEVTKDSGSDLVGLFDGIDRLRRFLETDAQAGAERKPDTAALPQHLEMLLLEAARTSGTLAADDFLPCIEERLTLEECSTVRSFLDWLVRQDLSFGHGNLQERFAAFSAARF